MKLHYSKEVKRQMTGRRRVRIRRINWKEVGRCAAALLYGIGVAGIFVLYLFFG